MDFLKNGKASDRYTESLEKEIDAVKASEEWRKENMPSVKQKKKQYETVKHTFEPVYDENSKF